LEAATISIALVIFRVFCTLRIFILISLVPGMLCSPRALSGVLFSCYFSLVTYASAATRAAVSARSV
jgi:hypothetical protein